MTHISWQPSASWDVLQKRAQLITRLRQFFVERGILEVETPVLSAATVTDPHVIGIPALFKAIGSSEEKIYYLQTSPEYAMKRLLAAGSGPIFQITKSFRQGEVGQKHNPEFTMLEWYRPGFDHHALMDEMDALLQMILQTPSSERWSYHAIFEHFLGINPHSASIEVLEKCAKEKNIELHNACLDRDSWLDLLMTHCIEPHMGITQPVFLYDFPVSQAALAKIRFDETPPVASRFEVYFKGIELANGFHELQNAEEQEKRFIQNLQYRSTHQLPSVEIDKRFLAALHYGLPDCAGVALGVDRLMMLALGCHTISDVVSFDFSRA
jgi:lysyl-tRNA synthetase class 2